VKYAGKYGTKPPPELPQFWGGFVPYLPAYSTAYFFFSPPYWRAGPLYVLRMCVRLGRKKYNLKAFFDYLKEDEFMAYSRRRTEIRRKNTLAEKKLDTLEIMSLRLV
jgi:hypothetical protein